MDGRKADAIDEDYPRLRLAGRYLFFLRSVPQTGAYQGLAPDDVTNENPTQEALSQARIDLMGCGKSGSVR